MIKIIQQLMSFGMDFQYENYGSQGEQLTADQLGLEVRSEAGKIHYTCCHETETFDENDTQYHILSQRVQEECVKETASF